MPAVVHVNGTRRVQTVRRPGNPGLCDLLEALLTKGFQNIDPPESGVLEVELMNVDGEEWAKSVPEEASAQEIGEQIKANREIVRVRIGLRLGNFLLFPGFCVLCRPDQYEDFEKDPRARHIVGREALARVRQEGPRRRLVGFRVLDRAFPRPHYPIRLDGAPTGEEVRSGTVSPSLGYGIGRLRRT